MGSVEHQRPRISGPRPGDRRVEAGNILADGVALEAVDPTFALFEVDGVAGKIPVDDGVAERVEVESFLAIGCRRQDERPERGVERVPHL